MASTERERIMGFWGWAPSGVQAWAELLVKGSGDETPEAERSFVLGRVESAFCKLHRNPRKDELRFCQLKMPELDSSQNGRCRNSVPPYYDHCIRHFLSFSAIGK